MWTEIDVQKFEEALEHLIMIHMHGAEIVDEDVCGMMFECMNQHHIAHRMAGGAPDPARSANAYFSIADEAQE